MNHFWSVNAYNFQSFVLAEGAAAAWSFWLQLEVTMLQLALHPRYVHTRLNPTCSLQ